VVPRFADVLTAPEAPVAVAVDIPIGLPDCSEQQGRAPERVVRPLLGPRKSSVFRVPSRSAVYAGVDPAIPDQKERYVNACRVARATSEDRKAFSKQGFFLFSKIVEVDQLLTQERLVARVVETHPELAFLRLNDGLPVRESKKSEAGRVRRRQLLRRAGFSSLEVKRPPPDGAKDDDVLDALVCALIARHVHTGTARSFPARPSHDGRGLPMAIWAY
jgi:threonine dehydratase